MLKEKLPLTWWWRCCRW